MHSAAYVRDIEQGTLDDAAQRRIGLPWSEAFVERAFRVANGTVQAATHAVRHGIAMNLAGGTHHAHADFGEGFCVFNDVAIAIRRLQHDGAIARACIVDCDVHQGNGTNAIFADDDSVFTLDLHGARNFPFRKTPATRDVPLDDGTGDDAYLAALAAELPRALHAARADLVVYLAGADPHEGDRLGRLRLTFDGLAARDEFVLRSCREIGLPVCVVIAGGYGRDVRDTVRVHLSTLSIASRYAC